MAASKDPLEMADYVFCPHKKITSRTIKISVALIVKPFAQNILEIKNVLAPLEKPLEMADYVFCPQKK